MTQSCRINSEKATRFPFSCALSHMMRAKKLTSGMLRVRTKAAGGAGSGSGAKQAVHVRERTFLQNPHVPESIRVGAGPESIWVGAVLGLSQYG